MCIRDSTYGMKDAIIGRLFAPRNCPASKVRCAVSKSSCATSKRCFATSILVPISTESGCFIKLHPFLLNIFVKRIGFYPMIKMILISHHRHHPDAVSYTHLDVYKRQAAHTISCPASAYPACPSVWKPTYSFFLFS